MTGPEKPFEGALGLQHLVGPVDPGLIGRAPLAIVSADMKFYATEYHSHGPLAAALSLAAGLDPAAIAAIQVRTYAFAYKEIGSGHEKWRPATRETADHSLPYIVAAALVDGRFSDAVFAPERFSDPRILTLADKITVAEEPEFTRAFPQKFRSQIEMTLRDGTRRSAGLDVPHGHHEDPLTDAEVAEKFAMLAGRKLPPGRVDDALRLIRDFANCVRLDDLFDLLTIGHSA
jgi:2-methylcitrate dehydratase